MLTEQEFMLGMSILMRAYPDYECTPETVDVYRERLCSRLTAKEWEAAVNWHIDNCKWFPKISELLQAVQVYLPSPNDVWNQLLAAAEAGKKPKMDVPTAFALEVIGGWERFQYLDYDDLRFRYKEFKEAYLSFRDREAGAAALPPPAALAIEDQNSK